MKVNTSALIAELLLAGALVELVALLALDELAKGKVLSWVLGLDGTGAGMLASGAIVLAYYLGSLLNVLSRLVFRPVEKGAKKKILGAISSDESLRRRLAILVKSPELHAHVDELYAQIRIFRAAAVAFSFLVLILSLRSQPDGAIKWALIAGSAICALGSAISAWNRLDSYFRALRAAWQNLVEERKEGQAGDVKSS